jgi:hypothetical protein
MSGLSPAAAPPRSQPGAAGARRPCRSIERQFVVARDQFLVSARLFGTSVLLRLRISHLQYLHKNMKNIRELIDI